MGRVAAFGLLEVAGWIGNPLKSAVAIIRRLGGLSTNWGKMRFAVLEHHS